MAYKPVGIIPTPSRESESLWVYTRSHNASLLMKGSWNSCITLNNSQKIHYEESNNFSGIHASQNHFGCIQVATTFRYLRKAVGIFVLICYPHNPKYVTHIFADVL